MTLAGVGADLVTVNGEGGAGLAYVLYDGVTIEGITFTGASSVAIRAYDGLTVTDCAFTDNVGTVLDIGGEISLARSVFSGNTCASWACVVDVRPRDGGLIEQVVITEETGNYSIYGVVTISRSWVTGGAISATGSDSLIENSVLAGLGFRSALACIEAYAVSSSTIVGCNADSGSDGAPAVQVSSALTNSIVAYNAGPGANLGGGAAVGNLFYGNGGDDIEGTATWSVGNVYEDPLFREFVADGDWTSDDLRLQYGSPAIDAGSSDYPSTDYHGVRRPQDGDGDDTARADMGAFEWGLSDHDGDGWSAEAGDCDDLDAETSPDTPEIPYDGIDQDCDGEDLTDVDGDGHDADHQGGDDCDDTDGTIGPGAWDTPDDGIDQDCDGVDAHDEDGDGWSEEAGDCAPDDDAIHPGADELCDGVDNDCDGLVDDDCDTGAIDTGGTDTDGSDDSASSDTGSNDSGEGWDETDGDGWDTGVDSDPGERGGLCGCRGCADGGSGGAAWVLLPLLAAGGMRRKGSI